MKPAILLAFIALLVVGMARAETVWRVSAKNGNDAIGDNHPFISSAGLAILNPMNVGRYLLLGGLAFVALVAIVVFLGRILGVFHPGSGQAEAGGVVPYLALLGVLTFLTGLGLAIYSRGYEKCGLALAGLGFLAVWGSIFINHRKTRRW